MYLIHVFDSNLITMCNYSCIRHSHCEIYHPVDYVIIYTNQINAHALIRQSAMGHCASKPTEKYCIFWIIIFNK